MTPTATEIPYLQRKTTPHAYVAPAVRQWRTCAYCGIGANAKVHRG